MKIRQHKNLLSALVLTSFSLLFIPTESQAGSCTTGPLWLNPGGWAPGMFCTQSAACGASGKCPVGNQCGNCANDYPQYTPSTTAFPCSGNQVFNEETQECADPPPPGDPECVAEHGDGWVSLSLTIGTEEHITCVRPFPDTSQEDCEIPIGTVTYQGVTTVVCADESQECSNTGGTWGAWGPGDNPMTGCLPSDYNHPDICASNGAFVADAETSSFVCESPLDDLPNEVPNVDDDLDTDTDGDGTPDKNDNDIDGDGIPNSQDPDIDGDGINNEDDPTPEGEEEEDSSVEGGADCLVAPRCKGDAVQCSILYQTWKTRCETPQEELLEEVSDTKKIEILNSVSAAGTVAIDGVGDAYTSSIGDGQAGIAGPTGIGNDIPGIFNPGACSDLSFSAPNGHTMTLKCSDTQIIRTLLSTIAAVLTLFIVFQIATQRTEK